MRMNRRKRWCGCSTVLVASALLAPLPAMPMSITYTATSVLVDEENALNIWRYDYTVVNDLGFDIEGLQIFFADDDSDYDALDASYEDVGLYSPADGSACAPECPAGPAGWDLVVYQPVAELDLSAILDGLADSGFAIANNTSVSAFSIAFNWAGVGSPGAQYFEVYDPLNFDVLESGWTSAATVVPLPPAFWLMISALGVLGRLRR